MANMTKEELELAELEEELSTLKEENEQLEEAIKPTVLEAKKEEIRRAKLEKANLEAIMKYSADTGKKLDVDFARVDCPDGNMLLVKKIASATYKMITDQKNLGSKEIDACARACVVYPEDAKCVNSLFESFAPIISKCALSAMQLAGLDAEIVQKK